MKENESLIERSCRQTPGTLRLKIPPTKEQQDWMEGEFENYKIATKYIAFFFEARVKFGDVTEQEVWDEVKSNISMHARNGCDLLGVQ